MSQSAGGQTPSPRSGRARVLVSRHALQRYRERFDRSGDEAAVVAALGRAEPAPHWVRKAAASDKNTRVYVDGECVLLVGPRWMRGRPTPVVITVWPLYLTRRRMGTLREPYCAKKAGRPSKPARKRKRRFDEDWDGEWDRGQAC